MVGLHLWGVTTKIPLQSQSTSPSAEARLPKPAMVPGVLSLPPQGGDPSGPGGIADTSDSHCHLFSQFWTSDKNLYVSFSPLPLLFDSQTKGKHKLRKSCVKRPEGRRRGGARPVHSQVLVCNPVRPRAWSVGLGSPCLITEGTPCILRVTPKMQPHTDHPQLRRWPLGPQTAPLPQSPNRTFFPAEIFICPDL